MRQITFQKDKFSPNYWTKKLNKDGSFLFFTQSTDGDLFEKVGKGFIERICASWGLLLINFLWGYLKDLWELLYLCTFGIFWIIGWVIRIYLAIFVGKLFHIS